MAIRQITDIYKGYFQKSKVFLHPALGHKRGTSVTPKETYLSWDNIKISDNKLICLYYLRNDDEFASFEERYLYGNPLFEDYKEVGKNQAVYIFNFDEHKEDFNNVVKGRYSKLSEEQKSRIRGYQGASSSNYAFIDSYLYPEKYFSMYADILSPQKQYTEEMKNILTGVGELCSKPDLVKEVLKMSTKSFDYEKL